jgi:hypothetical protein
VVSGGKHLLGATQAEKYHLGARFGAERLACQAVCTGAGDVVVTQD